MRYLLLIVFAFLSVFGYGQVEDEEVQMFGGGGCSHQPTYIVNVLYEDGDFEFSFDSLVPPNLFFSRSLWDNNDIYLKISIPFFSQQTHIISANVDTILICSFYPMSSNMRKPVIYLYPEKETIVDLKLDFNGKLTNTYPDYEDGWQVIAKPNGDLISKKDSSLHRYLFWDGINDKNVQLSDFETGFVVKDDETLEFLDSTLTKIGLNDYEKNDFITFWMPEMKKNECNFVYFLINEECNDIASLEITPLPDSEIRVYMFFGKVDENKIVKPQNLTLLNRKGFVLIEWGGFEIYNIEF
jgi:hypothetical protein